MRLFGALTSGITGIFFFKACVEVSSLLTGKALFVQSPSVDYAMLYVAITLLGFTTTKRINKIIKANKNNDGSV